MEKIKLKVQTLLKTGFFHVFGSNVINKIIGFMSSIVLVRILSKTEYGAFTYAWNIYCIIALFNGMGVESGTLQLASEHSGDKSYARKISDYGTRVGLVFNVGLSLVTIGIGLFAPLTINGAKVHRLVAGADVLLFTAALLLHIVQDEGQIDHAGAFRLALGALHHAQQGAQAA